MKENESEDEFDGEDCSLQASNIDTSERSFPELLKSKKKQFYLS